MGTCVGKVKVFVFHFIFYFLFIFYIFGEKKASRGQLADDENEFLVVCSRRPQKKKALLMPGGRAPALTYIQYGRTYVQSSHYRRSTE